MSMEKLSLARPLPGSEALEAPFLPTRRQLFVLLGIYLVVLQFHPSIVWESQRELTHSLVACVMILATLFFLLRLSISGEDRPPSPLSHAIGRGDWGPWLGFGICGGLSILSKYNAALLYAEMLISAVSLH